MFANGYFNDRKKELFKGTYKLILRLPRNILNNRSPSSFCHIGSVTCRDTSSSIITLASSMSHYWDNLPRGPFDSKQGSATLSTRVSTLVCYHILDFKTNCFGSVRTNTCDYSLGTGPSNLHGEMLPSSSGI